MAKISFSGLSVPVNYKGRQFTFLVDGSAECEIDGYYKYHPAVLYLPNGDPGDPDQFDCEIETVSLITDIRISEYVLDSIDDDGPDLSDEEIEKMTNTDEFMECLEENTAKDYSPDAFDYSDCVSALVRQQEDEKEAAQWEAAEQYGQMMREMND